MFLRIFHRSASTTAQFTYPKRVVRSPTAILETLNSCVQTDGSNPSYTFMDDPFLIPTSAHEKRQLALSKASGKKAARWIMDHYSYAFFHDVAVPSIPSYFPNYTFDEREFIEPDENLIYKLMNWNRLTKAYEMYKKCLELKIDLSDSCKYALFDLLCISNSVNPSEILPAEEDWYRQELAENNQANAIKRTWKENSLADQLFEELKISANNQQKSRLYNSYASGLLKYNHIEKAQAIIDEMKQSQIQFDLTTYNYLLRSTSLIKESYDARWQFVVDCLKEMKEKSIQPNLRTFNSILSTLRRCSAYEHGPTLAMKILNEMRQCSIEPSLGTWAHIIMIYYPNDQLGYETQILPQIFDYLEKQEQLEWRDIDDGEFFFNAMFKATVNCRDIDLAKRIHRFLMKGSNNRFIPDGFKEQMYYTNLFRLLFRFDMPEQVMPLWESLVPNIYSPSINIIENFIEFVSTWNLEDYYVRLWSDLLLLGFMDNRQHNRRILEKYLNLIERSKFVNQYANIARQILKRFPLQEEEEQQQQQQEIESVQDTTTNSQQQRKFPPKQPFQYSGNLLSYLINILTNAQDFEACWSLYEYYLAHKNTVINPLTEKSLMNLLDLTVKENQIDRSINIIETINELRYECLSNALDLLNRRANLDLHDRQRLKKIQKGSKLESAQLVKLI